MMFQPTFIGVAVSLLVGTIASLLLASTPDRQRDIATLLVQLGAWLVPKDERDDQIAEWLADLDAYQHRNPLSPLSRSFGFVISGTRIRIDTLPGSLTAAGATSVRVWSQSLETLMSRWDKAGERAPRPPSGPRVTIERETKDGGSTNNSFSPMPIVVGALLALGFVLALSFTSTFSTSDRLTFQQTQQTETPSTTSAEPGPGAGSQTLTIFGVVLAGLSIIALLQIAKITSRRQKQRNLHRSFLPPAKLGNNKKDTPQLDGTFIPASTPLAVLATICLTLSLILFLSTGNEPIATDEFQEQVELADGRHDPPVELVAYAAVALIAAALLAGEVARRIRSGRWSKAWSRFSRRRKRNTTGNAESSEGEETGTRVLTMTALIEDLRSESEPRRAIQRTYEAVESGFDQPRLRRMPHETSMVYLDRVLDPDGDLDEPLRNLTSLFTLARYSEANIDEAMRSRAIETLIEIRNSWSDRSDALQTRTETADVDHHLDSPW